MRATPQEHLRFRLHRTPCIGVILLLLVFFVLPLDARQVRVASFNVEHGVARMDPGTGEFEDAIQAGKYAAISAVVARVDADIIGFQELYQGAAHFESWVKLAEELGYEHWVLSEVGDNAFDHLRVGYFSRFPILSAHNLKSSPDGAELGRAPLRVVIDVPDAANPLTLWNMHFRSGSAPHVRFMRYVEAKRIVEDIETYRAANPGHHEFIVLGDFNDDITQPQFIIQSGESYNWGVNWYNPLPDLHQDYGFVITGTHNDYNFSVATPILYPIFPVHHFMDAGGGMFHVDMTQTGSTNIYTHWKSQNPKLLDYILVSDSLFDNAVGEIYNSEFDGVGVGLPKAGDPPPWDVSFTSDHFAVFADIHMTPGSDVLPSTARHAMGEAGGPFDPDHIVFTVTNTNAFETHWAVSVDVDWLTVDLPFFDLPSLTYESVEISLNPNADLLLPGTYAGAVVFSNETTGAVEPREITLTVLDYLEVFPHAGFISSGAPGGPFDPASKVFTVTNKSAEFITFTATAAENWITVTPSSGSLNAGQSGDVTISINPNANGLEAGLYSDTVIFSNQLTGLVETRPVSLEVVGLLCVALDHCDLTWTTGGTAPWFFQTEVTFDGIDAAASGLITHNQESWMETTVEGPGLLDYHWKVSSEADYDFLEFRINGILQNRISGDVDWEHRSYVLESGTHTLRWRYDKDFSITEGADRGWVDQVSFVSGTPPDASDHAAYYTANPITFEDGANEGAGFLPWDIQMGSGATAVLEDSTVGAGNINSTNGVAFRFYGGAGNTYVDAIRPFEYPLRPDDVFRVTISYNWNGGARGVNILAADDSELMNVNFTGGDVLNFRWGNWPESESITLSTNWSPTAVLHIAVTQLADNELAVELTRNDGYSTNLVSSGLWTPATKVHFYNGGHAAYNANYALYANDLFIIRHDNLTDGIPNWWWERYGVAMFRRRAHLPVHEDDYTYRDAWIADTDPTDPNARFPFVEAESGSDGLMTIIIDPTSTARIYRVEWASDLLADPQEWSLYPPEKSGTGGAITFAVTNHAPFRIYRTGVRLP